MNVFTLLKTVCFPNTLFKATPQKPLKFVFFDKFRLMALLLLLMMAQGTYTVIYSGTAKCNNNNVEVQTFDAIDLFQPKNGTSHSLPFPAHTIQHNCMKYLLKYPSPVKTRNPDEPKFVQPSSSKKMWSAYVGLHNLFEFQLKIRCTVEFQAPFSLGKV